MKVLITGANSYVGENIRKVLEKENYYVNELDMQNKNWILHDFSQYDVCFHVAAIVHDINKKKKEDLYYKINCDLAIEVANKAKKEGIRQFIFMSTIAVYGKVKFISNTTSLNPNTLYGKSKLMAEEKLKTMDSELFHVAIVRPPMIFGKNCKGNFSRLKKLVLKTSIFPNITNQRSMIYIENFAEFIKLLIKEKSSGIFHPQDKEYFCTTTIAKLIRLNNGKKIHTTIIFNWLITLQ